jgi:hypothetical protein
VASLTWQPDTFAYASAFDEDSGRYNGLVAAVSPAVTLDGLSVVVKPDVAQHQIEEDRKRAEDAHHPAGPVETDRGKEAAAQAGQGVGSVVPPERRLPVRFYARTALKPVRMLRDVSDIADAVVHQLGRAPDAHVSVTVEIEATSAGGFDDDVRRTVTENARTLRFEVHEFESE